MNRSTATRSRARRSRAVRAAAVAAAAAAMAVPFSSGTAQAQDGVVVGLDYPINGTTHLDGPGSDVTLGPGTLETTVALPAGTITAETKLPPATTTIEVLGLPVVKAKTEFIEARPTTGTVDMETGVVRTTSYLTLRITEMKIAGIPALVGSRCQTEEPARIDLVSQEGFNVLEGGPVAGTYTIPEFEHCLLNTPLINLVIPGGGNTITLDLGTPVERPLG